MALIMPLIVSWIVGSVWPIVDVPTWLWLVPFTPCMMIALGSLLVILADWHVFFRRNPSITTVLYGPGPINMMPMLPGPVWEEIVRRTAATLGTRTVKLVGGTAVGFVVGTAMSFTPLMEPTPFGNYMQIKFFRKFGMESSFTHGRHQFLEGLSYYDPKDCVDPKGIMTRERQQTWISKHQVGLRQDTTFVQWQTFNIPEGGVLGRAPKLIEGSGVKE